MSQIPPAAPVVVPPPAPHQQRAPSMLAVAGVIAAMSLAALGNGLMFAYIPLRLAADGFAPTWAASILTGLSLGGIAACFLTAPLVRHAGHARALMALAAMIALSNVIIAASVLPTVWVAARMLYGLAICGMFIVAQSWLNDALPNAVRGRVMAVFYVSYVAGLGFGSAMIGLVDLQTLQGPLLGIAFALLSILPAGLSRLPQPAAPATARVALREAWRISPAGIAGMLAVGGLSMMIGGFGPIHVTASGYTQGEVAALMFALPFGTILLQYPLGWISDRTDRRRVMVAAGLLVAGLGLSALWLDGGPLPVVIAIYMLWAGASDSIYSLANAHAGDRARREDLVSLSSSMLFAWSVAGFIVPGIATLLTAVFGTGVFILMAIGIAAIYVLFVAGRIAASRQEAALPAASGTD